MSDKDLLILGFSLMDILLMSILFLGERNTGRASLLLALVLLGFIGVGYAVRGIVGVWG